MSKFLILSESGAGLGLGVRLKAEGHDVKMKVFDADYNGLGEGLVESAERHELGQTIIADCTGFGAVLDAYRDAGIPVFGGSSFADKLEADRKFAEQLMHDAGIETPKSASCESWEDARKLVKKFASSGKVVLKPEGSMSGNVPSYVASDEEDALEMLKQYEKKAPVGVKLTVQEFVKGLDLSTEGWFNGEDWIPGMFNHTIERKQFLNDNLGPSSGCTGNVVWGVTSKDPIVKETLIKLTDVMRKHRYVGPIDINCVINNDGVYALEFTPRFGYDAFPTALYSLCDFDFGSFIGDLCRGEDSLLALREGFGAGVRLGLPPWPSESFKAEDGVALRGMDLEAREYFYPYEVAFVDDVLQTSKGYGILGVMTYEGRNIGQAMACVYHQISKLKVPNLQYRTDLTEQCLKDFRELDKIVHGGEEGWIGVDLDGTLAEYSSWSVDIGEPIPKMVSRVKRWIAEGKEVRILTARGSFEGDGESGKYVQLMKIYDWVERHIGTPLEVTCKKDVEMLRLYDDRVVQVVQGTGELVKA